MTHGNSLQRPRSAAVCPWLCAALLCLAVSAHADASASAPAPAAAATPTAAPATATSTAAVHPDVQRALSYKLPEMDCAAPVVRQKNQNPGQAEAYERKMHFYIRCVEDYQRVLFVDFKFMQTSVSHGVTMAQAAVVKTNLESIAARIKLLQNTGSAAQKAWLKASGERSEGSGNTKGAGDMGLRGGGVKTF